MASSASARRRLLGVAIITVLFALGCGARGCTGRKAPDSAVAPATLPPPTLRLAFVSDPKGYLEPCGCTSRPLGGVDRLAAQIATLRRDSIPVAVLAVGDLFFEGPTDDDARRVQDRFQAETLVDVWNGIGIDAATPGARDLARGSGELLALRARARFPWLLAGVEMPDAADADAGVPDAGASSAASLPGHRILELAGVKVGLVGVADLGVPVGQAHDGIVVRVAPLEAARAAVGAARAEGAQVIVALVRGDRRLGRDVAELPGVDFVLQGGIDVETPVPPASRADAFVLHAGRQGQRVVVVDVHRRGDGAFRDESPWTRDVERRQIVSELEDRRRQIAEWQNDRSIAAADLAEQRRRVAAMEREAAALDVPPDVRVGNAFVAQPIELAPTAPRDEAVQSILSEHDRRVNEHNRVTLTNLVPAPARPGEASFVGSRTCQTCHESAYAWWSGHPHGRAYQTLVTRHKEFSLSCVGCHVTGYNQPGGSTVTHNRDGALVNVGCESCHGAGSEHVRTPATTNIRRVVPAATCINCHNEEHSDLFDYDTFRRRIVVPGHGLPARAQ